MTLTVVQDDLRKALAVAIQHQDRGEYRFDRAVYEAVMGLPKLGWETLGPFFENLLRDVNAQLSGPTLCGYRKQYQRAWIRGAGVALFRRNMSPRQALVPLAHLTLLTSYDEGVPCHVFSHTCAWGLGQVWGIISRDRKTHAEWEEALLSGVELGLKTLRSQETEILPSMLKSDKDVLSAAKNGYKVGSLLALAKSPGWATE